jgi:transposase-like protein
VADVLSGSYRRSEQAIIAAIAEMAAEGASTRDVDDVARALFGEGVSKGQASRMCAVPGQRGLDEYYPFVIVDATCLKVRQGARVVSNALCVAIGADASGRSRGPKRAGLVAPGGYTGLREAVKEEFLGASWQRCQTHFTRNMSGKVPKPVWGEARPMPRDACHAPDKDKA